MDSIRVQKYISDCGVCSRRAAEKLIEEGRVFINGEPAHLGSKVLAGSDRVEIDHKLVKTRRGDNLYIMMYKPRGYVTTASDDLGRKCVMDILSSLRERVYPVGRLDKDSEGLLILTNDGELANKLMHPKNRIGKTYRTIVRGSVDRKQITSLSDGVLIDGTYKTAPADVEILRVKDDRTVLSITIYEGKNRQIRKMCESVGLEILRLKREKIGDLSIGTLRSGQYRLLDAAEIEYLKKM